eukprot:4466732-Prymnesium_polylepis.1
MVELRGALGSRALDLDHEHVATARRVLLKSEPLREGRMLNQTEAAVVWIGASGRRTASIRDALKRFRGWRVRLRFRLLGSAVLYAFQLAS